MLMASCADEFDRNFEVGRPDKTEQYAYLSEYKALKEYIDVAKYPNFKLGVGTDAADYAKQGATFVITNVNFNETVAGNAMKMASCIDDKGSMNFSTVEAYVKEAVNAGMSVYGHTLAWHAQQPVKWLNLLMADKPVPVDPNAPTVDTWVEQITNGDCEGSEAGNFVVREKGQGDVNRISDGVGVDGSRGIMIHSVEDPGDDWNTQFFIYTPDHIWKTGDKYKFKMKARADKPASISLQAHNAPGGYIHWTMLAGSYNLTTDWQEFTYEGEISGDQGAQEMHTIAFNLNVMKEDNTYYFDDMSWEGLIKATGPVKFWEDVITNGDMEGDDVSCFFTTEPSTGGPHPSTIYDGVGKDGTRGIMLQSEDNPAQDWDTQFFIRVPEMIQAGTKIHVQFDYKADGEGDCDTQAHNEPGAYQHWACIGSPHFTTQWQHYDKEVTVDGSMAGEAGMRTIAFNLAKNKKKTKFYFDNVVFEVEKESASGGIPQTDEEKRDTLIYAMDKWIHGMMNACKDDDTGATLVKAWDVVNEAISGGNPDGEGVYALQHATPGNTTDFFWQDYLGDLDYVRTAVALARKYGGNDLKLFVNDYNLESDWDNNGKLKSLIKWIQRWEADGVTKIDGIGSQMHISYYMNPQTLESKKKAIVESFKLMAATGKLVRISELDMGLVDENGKDVVTPDVTEEQHHAMADYYKWIIQQYLTIIPVAQQWGITQWCATDSPAGSGWRANQPVGLWDQNYYRKHTYAGFADGLSGK